jgi:hypothetical protein
MVPLVARMVTLVAGGLAVAGCGDASGGAPPAPTRVVVEVRPEGPGGPVETSRIVCTPEDSRAVCNRLRTTSREHFAPVPRKAMCTAIYGGPATATVEGRLARRPLRARFELSNGCEIARWERFAWLLGPPAGNFGPAAPDTPRDGG